MARVCLNELTVVREDDGDVNADLPTRLKDVVGDEEALGRVGVDPSGQFSHRWSDANERTRGPEPSPRVAQGVEPALACSHPRLDVSVE